MLFRLFDDQHLDRHIGWHKFEPELVADRSSGAVPFRFAFLGLPFEINVKIVCQTGLVNYWNLGHILAKAGNYGQSPLIMVMPVRATEMSAIVEAACRDAGLQTLRIPIAHHQKQDICINSFAPCHETKFPFYFPGQGRG